MGSQKDFDAMADACIRAGRLVKSHGSTELQAAMRFALFVLGREMAESAIHAEQSEAQHDATAPFARVFEKQFM